MIRSEERRLKSLFHMLLASVAMPAAMGCSSSSNGTTPDASAADTGGGTPDTGTMADTGGGTPDSGGGMNDAGAGSDASDGGTPSCTVSDPFDNDASIVETDGGARRCYYFRDFSCGPTLAFNPAANCYMTLADCASICPQDAGGDFDCHFWEGYGCTDGGTTWTAGQPARVACGICSGVGRRPGGLEEPGECEATSELGEYFARVAHLEAASVHAFRALGEELRAFGAPASLVRAAARSAKDEVRHARTTRRLARRFGGAQPRVRVRKPAARSLEAVALENAVEGCVRETFGALVASWQASHAQDARIRRSMARIAEDETRHAALAWAVAGWIEEKLDAKARARVARARKNAVKELLRDAASTLDRQLVATAGLPSERIATALASELRDSLWS